ncbi:MAG TPA: hypothetical protein VNK04_03145 [Gemmataceae bacterium]|nr:hypothetical protein [Gemmataceae bacterium]
MKRFAILAALAIAITIVIDVARVESCGRRRQMIVFGPLCPCITSPSPSVVPSKRPDLTPEGARLALIRYLKSTERAKGPATLLNVRANRDALCEDLLAGKLTENDGVYYIAGFHISVSGNWYAIKMVGRGFFEDYRGEFEFDGTQWKATPAELRAIGHFKDKDGFK